MARQPKLGVFKLKPEFQKKKSPSPKKPASMKKKSARNNKKKLSCFRMTRKANTNKGKAGSKYLVCIKPKKTKKNQKGGFVRGGSVQQFAL